MRRFATLLLLVALAGGCVPPPPNLTPRATTAFKSHQVQDALDQIRDIMQAGNATTPPVFSNSSTRIVTRWHESAIIIVHTAGTGWKATVETGLKEVVHNLPQAEQAELAPYVTLAITILEGIVQ